LCVECIVHSSGVFYRASVDFMWVISRLFVHNPIPFSSLMSALNCLLDLGTKAHCLCLRQCSVHYPTAEHHVHMSLCACLAGMYVDGCWTISTCTCLWVMNVRNFWHGCSLILHSCDRASWQISLY
jgi:hypothetical protein